MASQERVKIRIFSEFGGFPMWSPGGALSADAARNELGLSEEVVSALAAWGFESDLYVVPADWPASHRAWGTALTSQVQRELGENYDVIYLGD